MTVNKVWYIMKKMILRIEREVKYMEIFDKIYAAIKDFINSYIAMIKKLIADMQGLKDEEKPTAN